MTNRSTSTKTLIRWLALVMLLFIMTNNSDGQQVLINEVYTGDPDYVELANNGASTVNLSGWRLETTFGFTAYPVFTLPINTTLAPGGCLVLVENNTPLAATLQTASPTFPVILTGINYGWVGNSTGSVALIDPQGVCRDLVVFGTTGVALSAAALAHPFSAPLNRSGNNVTTDDALYRHSGIDTDSGQDWTNGSDGDETPGVNNPGQILGPVDIQSLGFDSTQPHHLILDPALGTFQLTAVIASAKTIGAQLIDDPACDSLIGGTLNATGHYVSPSSSASSLSNVILSPVTLTLTTQDGTDQLTLITLLQATSYTGFQLQNSVPRPLRELTTLSSNSISRTGAGSLILNSLQSALASAPLSLVFREDNQHASLLSLERSFSPAQPSFEASISNDGNGRLIVGAVGAPSGAELYNLFSVNPSTPFGTGPLLGIELGSFQLAQIALPLGQAPFHVLPNGNGNYVFATTSGMVPAGLTIDHVALAVTATSLVSDGPTRVTF